MEPAVFSDESKKSGKDGGKAAFTVGVIVVVVNLVIIDFLMVKDNILPFVSQNGKIESIEWKLSSLTKQVDMLSGQMPRESTGSTSTFEPQPKQPTETAVEKEKPTVQKVVQQVSAPTVKEFYVPLGQASARTENFSWTDTGVEATIDLSRYPDVKEVTFEATLSAPAGQVEARLYNVSDGYAINSSTVIGNDQKPKLYRSDNIVLSEGSKTYRVQMRTSLNYTASMDAARIRILLN